MARPKKGSPEAKARDLKRRMERARQALGAGASEAACVAWVEAEKKADAERLAEGKRRAHQERLAAARRALGASAPPSALEAWVAEQKKREREQKDAATSAAKKTKVAAKATREASKAVAALTKEEAPMLPPDPTRDFGAHMALSDDPDFGSSFDGTDEVFRVRVERLVSTRPEHNNVPGVRPNEKFDFPYDRGQTKANTEFLRGGGRYRAYALTRENRVVKTTTFEIDGPPKPTPGHEPQEEPAAGPPGHPYVVVGPNGNRFAAHQPPPWEQSPPWAADPSEERLDRLERLLEQTLTRPPVPTTPPIDYEARQRYEDAKAERDQKRADEERRWRQERDDQARKDREEREDRAHARELEFRREEAARAAALQETIFKTLARPKDDGSAAAMQALQAVTGSFMGLATGMMETVSAAANREDSRSLVDRLLEGLAENMGPVLAGAKDIASTLAQRRAEQQASPAALAAPAPQRNPEAEPQPSFPDPVVLPDGRAIAAVHVQRIILEFEDDAKRRGSSRTRPTDEELHAILSEALDLRPDLDVSAPDIVVPPPPEEPKAREEAPTAPPPSPLPQPVAPWASHRCLYYVKRAFEEGVDPADALGQVLESRDLSERACRDIGAIYARHTSIKAAFLEIALRFQQEGLRPLPGFLPAFEKAGEKGREWLNVFLGAAAHRFDRQQAAA